MPQYKLAANAQAEQLEAKAAGLSKDVAVYIQRADDYVLAVVLFAASLFFAGISTRLHSRDARVGLLGLGWIMFLGTAIWLATFPISIAV
jgi:hypothetical protein